MSPMGASTAADNALAPVPEAARTRRVSGQFWIWAGANTAPINWVLGALGIALGLGLVDTLVVLVVGNLIGMGLFGLFVLMGQRTGVTGMVLSRAAFGRRGAYLPAAIQAVLAIGWCAVNTWIVLDLVMALLAQLGVVDPTQPNVGAKTATAALIMAVQVAISWAGYRAISAFERWTVPPTLLVLVAMSLVAWVGLDIDWSYAGPPGAVLTGTARWSAMTAVMTAIGIGWGITWFTYAADYSRFVSTEVPRHRLYLASVLGQIVPVVWLGVLGATLATRSGGIDPGQLIVDNYGTLAVPVLLLIVHGPLATNVLNMYTCSVTVQALDVTVERRRLNLVVGVLAMAVVVVLIHQDDIAVVLDTWLIGLVAWIAAWAGIMLVHYYRLERQNLDVGRLFDPVHGRRLPDVNPAALIAFAAGVIATWLCMYGTTAMFQGPVARALGGVDLSWLAGGLTSAAVYAVLGPVAHRRYVPPLRPGRLAPRTPGRPEPRLLLRGRRR